MRLATLVAGEKCDDLELAECIDSLGRVWNFGEGVAACGKSRGKRELSWEGSFKEILAGKRERETWLEKDFTGLSLETCFRRGEKTTRKFKMEDFTRG